MKNNKLYLILSAIALWGCSQNIREIPQKTIIVQSSGEINRKTQPVADPEVDAKRRAFIGEIENVLRSRKAVDTLPDEALFDIDLGSLYKEEHQQQIPVTEQQQPDPVENLQQQPEKLPEQEEKVPDMGQFMEFSDEDEVSEEELLDSIEEFKNLYRE